MKLNPKKLKSACYASNVSMAAVTNLTPLLFLTFRQLYGISYTLLGLLVVINFVTQLGIDLIFSFFSHKFNIPLTVKTTPVITAAGFISFAILPVAFPSHAYLGLAIGTVLFSLSGGLCEVLISPTIAALPSENPDREMSKLHSVYAWGVVAIVILSAIFLSLTKAEVWYVLPLALSIVPFVALFLFIGSGFPEMKTPEKVSGALSFLRRRKLWIYLAVMLLGGAAECTMAQWCSGFAERALNMPKLLGDIFGPALFAAMLGLGRSMYAKFGKRIEPVLLFSAVGATLCYVVAALSPLEAVGLVACALTGLATAMLWPGNLIATSSRFADGGVLLFAIMAAAGDLGASIAPQLVGVITDAAMLSPAVISLGEGLSLGAEQIAMRIGILCAGVFPLAAIPLYLVIIKWRKKDKSK